MTLGMFFPLRGLGLEIWRTFSKLPSWPVDKNPGLPDWDLRCLYTLWISLREGNMEEYGTKSQNFEGGEHYWGARLFAATHIRNLSSTFSFLHNGVFPSLYFHRITLQGTAWHHSPFHLIPFHTIIISSHPTPFNFLNFFLIKNIF